MGSLRCDLRSIGLLTSNLISSACLCLCSPSLRTWERSRRLPNVVRGSEKGGRVGKTTLPKGGGLTTQACAYLYAHVCTHMYIHTCPIN